MSKNRVIYNQVGTFVGPCPSTGYHYLSTDGVPTSESNPDLAFNLVFPLNRITQASYNFTKSRSDIKSLGYYGTIARPILNHDVNLSLSFWQMGLINEKRLGFMFNHPSTNNSTGTPVYSNKVIPISGFLDRNFNSGIDTVVGWPLTTRDFRNIFVATKQNNDDLNNTSSGTWVQSNLDVFAFGDCYLQRYSTNGAVGQIPQVDVNFVCNNIEFYNYASGKNIPSVDTRTFTKIPDKAFSLPNNFQGTGLPTVLLPKDINISINRHPENLPAPIAYWSMDGNANDIIGGGYHGTGVDVTFSSSTGKINQGAVFSSTGRIDIQHNSAFNINNVTLSAWVYTSGFGTYKMIFEKEPLHVSPYGLFFETNDIHFRTSPGDDLTFSVSSAGITNNTWHHIVGTYDGNIKRLYVNGVEKISSGYSTPISNNNSALVIGAASGYPQFYLSGAVDEVGIWNKALTATEVSILYNNGNGLQSPFQFTPTINTSNLPIDINDIKIQSYNIDLDLPREPLYNLGYRLPMDRVIKLPVFANLEFNTIVGENSTGSLVDLIKDDKEYDIVLKLNYQTNSANNNGVAVQYEFLGAKLNNMNLSESISQMRLANFSFTSEINPKRLDKGFFMSGQLGIPYLSIIGEVLLGDDFFGEGARSVLLTESSEGLVLSPSINRPIY